MPTKLAALLRWAAPQPPPSPLSPLTPPPLNEVEGEEEGESFTQVRGERGAASLGAANQPHLLPQRSSPFKSTCFTSCLFYFLHVILHVKRKKEKTLR